MYIRKIKTLNKYYNRIESNDPESCPHQVSLFVSQKKSFNPNFSRLSCLSNAFFLFKRPHLHKTIDIACPKPLYQYVPQTISLMQLPAHIS